MPLSGQRAQNNVCTVKKTRTRTGLMQVNKTIWLTVKPYGGKRERGGFPKTSFGRLLGKLQFYVLQHNASDGSQEIVLRTEPGE